MSKNIIYGLLNPFTQELKYIGKSETGLQRCKEHLKPSSLKKDTRKDRWIKSILRQGAKPEAIIIEKVSSPNDLFEAEAFWYEYYTSIGCDLANSTLCGKGTRGYKHKEETIVMLKEKALIRDKTPYSIPHNKKESRFIGTKEFKECSICLCYYIKEDFGVRKIRKGTQTYCKSCRKDYMIQWRKANPTPLLSKEEFNASRLPGAKAGGLAISNSPTLRANLSKKLSKAIQAVHSITGEILTFTSALAAKEAGFQNTNIGQAIKYNKPYRGYIWSFI